MTGNSFLNILSMINPKVLIFTRQQSMKKTRNILMYEVCASIVLSLITVVIYETDTLLPGSLASDGNAEFAAVSLMEILTICLIPLALRLFRFRRVSESLVSARSHALLKWGSLRIAMLCLPMIANTLLYYQFMNVAFGYMGIIGLICLAFVWPGMKRCMAETGGGQ